MGESRMPQQQSMQGAKFNARWPVGLSTCLHTFIGRGMSAMLGRHLGRWHMFPRHPLYQGGDAEMPSCNLVPFADVHPHWRNVEEGSAD
eukprot:2996751-Prymnesium_polylepis.1